MAKKSIPQLQPTIFHDVDGAYRADTCEPLKAAARANDLTLDAFGRNCYPGTKLPPKMMPELCLACVWDAKQDQNWGLQRHRNEGIELGFVCRGKLDFIVNDQLYKLTPGSLTVTRPWQPHKVGEPQVHASRVHWLILDVGVRRPNEPWKWPEWLVMSPTDLARFNELLRYNEQPVWRANEKVENCFEKIADLLKSDPESVQTRLKLYINELFLEVFELLQKKNIELDAVLATTQRSVEMFLAALPDHLNYPWTLAAMAEHCNLGRTRFAHYCYQITNMSPAKYLADCRVKVAQKLLETEGQKSITDIAFICGFESSQYFATVFKQKLSLTPKEYRDSKCASV